MGPRTSVLVRKEWLLPNFLGSCVSSKEEEPQLLLSDDLEEDDCIWSRLSVGAVSCDAATPTVPPASTATAESTGTLQEGQEETPAPVLSLYEEEHRLGLRDGLAPACSDALPEPVPQPARAADKLGELATRGTAMRGAALSEALPLQAFEAQDFAPLSVVSQDVEKQIPGLMDNAIADTTATGLTSALVPAEATGELSALTAPASLYLGAPAMEAARQATPVRSTVEDHSFGLMHGELEKQNAFCTDAALVASGDLHLHTGSGAPARAEGTAVGHTEGHHDPVPQVLSHTLAPPTCTPAPADGHAARGRILGARSPSAEPAPASRPAQVLGARAPTASPAAPPRHGGVGGGRAQSQPPAAPELRHAGGASESPWAAALAGRLRPHLRDAVVAHRLDLDDQPDEEARERESSIAQAYEALGAALHVLEDVRGWATPRGASRPPTASPAAGRAPRPPVVPRAGGARPGLALGAGPEAASRTPRGAWREPPPGREAARPGGPSPPAGRSLRGPRPLRAA